MKNTIIKIIVIVLAVVICMSVLFVLNQPKTMAEVLTTNQTNTSVESTTINIIQSTTKLETTTKETTTKETTTKSVTNKSSLKKSPKKEITTQNKTIKCKLTNFETEGSISQSEINECIRAINALPQNLLDSSNSNGWKVILTSYNIAKKYYDGNVKGSIGALTCYEEKIVYISNKDAYPNIRDNVFHEFGHVLDSLVNKKSNTIEFQNVYNDEKDDLIVQGASKRQLNHVRGSSTEYFAGSFTSYMQNKNNCKNRIPETYAFIQNCLSCV